MRTAMRIVIGLVGLFNILIGLGFLLRPEKLGMAFFLMPLGSQGMASLRADFTGFFIGAATFALAGAWKADPRPLLVPLVMLALALLGRAVSIGIDGLGPDAIGPMAVEVVMVALLLVARGSFGARA